MAELSGQEIYDNFQNGIGSEGLSTGAAMVKAIAERYRERADQIQQLDTEMEAAWQGDAAGAAQRGAGPLMSEHVGAGLRLRMAEELTDRQSGSFDRARNSVMPVPDAPAGVTPWGSANPDWVPYGKQVEEHNAAAQHNVDVMSGYFGASTFNTDNLPASYGELADDQAGITIGDADTVDSGSFGDSGIDSGSHGGPRHYPPDTESSGEGPTGGSGGPGSVVPPGTQVPPGAGTTTPEGYSPLPSGSPSTPLPGGEFGQPRPAPTGVGLVPGVGVGFPGAGGGGATRGGPRGGGVTGGPVGGNPAPRGGGGVGAEQPGARAAAAPGVTGTPAGRGTAPGMGGVPVGGGRGRGDEDSERKTPTYLEGGDPEDNFGSELMTAPPVIGDEDDD